MKKQLLIAVDGSIYSSQSLEYIDLLFADNPDINFHLMTCISASQSVIPVAADSSNSLMPFSSGGEKKKQSAQYYLQNATDKLIRLQIAPERIDSTVEMSGYNIAAAIQHQAEHLLVDSILVGRRGLNTLSEMLLGSVSTTLLKKCHEIPLWIIDGEVTNKNFLAPIDGSLPSLLAIDHLAHIMEGQKDITIYLFHCLHFLGKKIEPNPESFYHIWDKEWCDTHLTGEDHLFQGPKQLLIEAGIPENKIVILPEISDLEAAHGIIRQAEKHQCGTIVIGRRGDEIAKGILGGVSDRTIKHAQDIALWVVG
ncbi:MAG: universal stress protein [Desulfocapsaceae bacterium]|nr:universal stress protein [Desulfocapsaceae bacterium]